MQCRTEKVQKYGLTLNRWHNEVMPLLFNGNWHARIIFSNSRIKRKKNHTIIINILFCYLFSYISFYSILNFGFYLRNLIFTNKNILFLIFIFKLMWYSIYIHICISIISICILEFYFNEIINIIEANRKNKMNL